MAAQLIIRNGSVVTPEGVAVQDVVVDDGRIARLEEATAERSLQEVDARGLHVFPGVMDAHVHFNEPGREGWEGIATGSAAAAAGGGTAYFDMPLNSTPPVCTQEAFDAKAALCAAKSRVDFGLWGGLVPGAVSRMEAVWARGAVGFKAFMSGSGVEDFPRADDLTLLRGMAEAARIGALVAVHAESESITAALATEAAAGGRHSATDFAASRPVVAEVEAVRRAIMFSEETGCRLHIVHVSSGRGVVEVATARKRGVDVTCETCPHYLALTEDDLERLGAIAKCAPPLRSASCREGLWSHLMAGDIAFVASDHSPAPMELKTSPNFFEVWGGIAGCQTLLPLLLTEGGRQGLTPDAVSDLTAAAVAQRFNIPRKGRIAPGYDADFALVELGAEFALSAADLQYRHRVSPYVGRTFTARVRQTIVRGQTVFLNGAPVGAPTGRLLRPAAD